MPGAKLKAEPHATPEIVRTRCFQCPAMSCIEQRKRTEPWRYYCEDMGRRVVPAKVALAECPRHRRAALGRPPVRRER